MGKRKCLVCGNANKPFFQFPSDTETRLKWLKAIENFTDSSKVTEHSLICKIHFEDNCFNIMSKSYRLIKGATPSLFNFVPNFEIPHTPNQNIETNSVGVQVDVISCSRIEYLEKQCQHLELQLQRSNEKYLQCSTKVRNLEQEMGRLHTNLNHLNKISQDAAQSDEKGIFLMDLINNYSKNAPRWSETTIRMCTVWRFCSPKGYEYCRKNLLKLPSKTTISRYLGKYNGSNELCKQRLLAEIKQLKVPIERICSLIIDDMSIKEKVHYCRSEDHIYGIDNCTSTNIGENPKIATQMLCFVVHGLSTKYTIPAGYFFHGSLSNDTFYTLTLNMLNLLTECGFIVLRLVTDNISSNVALFKKLSNGPPQNYIKHPFLEQIPLFLSFDFCHALKNARNLFLDHDMCSSEGVISSSFLKQLHNIQLGLPVKPVRYLTKKHLYPNNFEKMNVLRAVEIFSPSITSSLQFLKNADDPQFINVNATVSYMKNMYYFFQIHNVSTTSGYIRQLDSCIAPYVHISDERLEWLNVTFQNYIDDIQYKSANANIQGLTKETAHALKFTAKSTCLCIKFLLEQAGFYYVLTRSFSSDAVEAMFSHVRLRGGSNDATDARTAEYAMRQILRCGIVKSSISANIGSTVDYISTAKLDNLSTLAENQEHLLLPMSLRIKIQDLRLNIVPETNIYSASVAFLAGYIVKKISDKFNCDECLAPLLTTVIPGPLLQLIALQDRGGLTYPNTVFVGIIKQIADIVVEALPLLKFEKTCQQLVDIIQPRLQQNSIFCCSLHKIKVCDFVIHAVVKPILNNICLEKTDLIKKRPLHNKPTSRKILKL